MNYNKKLEDMEEFDYTIRSVDVSEYSDRDGEKLEVSFWIEQKVEEGTISMVLDWEQIEELYRDCSRIVIAEENEFRVEQELNREEMSKNCERNKRDED